jgi:hypothetical protein
VAGHSFLVGEIVYKLHLQFHETKQNQKGTKHNVPPQGYKRGKGRHNLVKN